MFNTAHIIKIVLFAAICLALLLPIGQQLFEFKTVAPLKGWFKKTKPQSISGSTWLDQSYQKNTENYLNENFGFRPDFVRLNNQLLYTISNETNSNGILIGKNHFLYEQSYINAHLGIDYIGKDSIHKKLYQLKLVTDTLKKLNIDITVILAPGKGSYFPEYFPDKYDTITKKQPIIVSIYWD